MNNSEEPTVRLVDQRVRNRIMELLEGLAEGENHVRDVGAYNWFEYFFDWYNYGIEYPPNTAMTSNEARMFAEIRQLMDEACDATPRTVTDEVLLASGWPQRIQPIAAKALEEMERRGRFSEVTEEMEPATKQSGIKS